MGVASKVPVAIWVAVGYFVVLAILLAAAPVAGALWGTVGMVIVFAYMVVVAAKANNRWFRGAQENLAPGETVRYAWKSGFPTLGQNWAVITTERLVVPRPSLVGRRVRSIPFSEIYLADTGEHTFGVGAYGGGLILGTTLSSRFLELDLTNGDVVKVRAPRPQVLRQQLVDAVTDWSQRQTP